VGSKPKGRTTWNRGDDVRQRKATHAQSPPALEKASKIGEKRNYVVPYRGKSLFSSYREGLMRKTCHSRKSGGPHEQRMGKRDHPRRGAPMLAAEEGGGNGPEVDGGSGARRDRGSKLCAFAAPAHQVIAGGGVGRSDGDAEGRNRPARRAQTLRRQGSEKSQGVQQVGRN